MPRQRCSFCGKGRAEVDHLLAGPGGVAICSECAILAHDVAAVAARQPSPDCLLTDVGMLVTNDDSLPGLLGLVRQAAVAVRGGRVAWAGPEGDLPSRFRGLHHVPCEGRAVLPGFVDAHTHLLGSGGEAVPDEALAAAVTRAGRMLAHGTTTLEIQAGSGDSATDGALLSRARLVGDRLPLDVITTWVIRDEVSPDVIREMASLASYAALDVDRHGLAEETARDVARAAVAAGFRLRLHADRARVGGAALAAEVGAVSVDHLERLERTADVEGGPVAVLTPATALAGAGSPARALWDAGVPVALATDCDPEFLAVESMPFVVALAAWRCGLALEEALWAATRGGALAIQDPHRGWIGPGATADMAILEIEELEVLAARPDVDPVWRVVKRGEVLS